MRVRKRTAILVFARAPVPGAAKTRLIPALGANGAASLQQQLTEHALASAMRAEADSIRLWCTPSPRHPFFRDCRRRYPIVLSTQRGEHLGERLALATVRELREHDAIVVIGTDCPVLTHTHIRSAVHALRDNDAVIFPAEDGGYVLLGLSKPCPEAFADIAWGGEHVFKQTMEKFSSVGRRVSVQDMLWDVDTPADLQRLAQTLPRFFDAPKVACRSGS